MKFIKSKLLQTDQDRKDLSSTFSQPLLVWYQKNRRKLPWRETKNPYAIFVSEMMLQQTQVKTVIPYYLRWMIQYPTPKKLAVASESAVLKSWEGLGYYRRARFLHAAAKKMVDQFNGQFPKTIEAIADLPGVGSYTLGAVASIAFNHPMPVVDGNVIRVLTRWFGIRETVNKTTTRHQLWKLAEQLIPEDQASNFNQAIMEHGALVCIPHKPLCSQCSIRNGCWAFQQNAQEKLPKMVPRRKAIHQFEYAGLVVHHRRILLCQRPAGQRLEHLWQFPSVIFDHRPSRLWKHLWKETFGSFQNVEKLSQNNYSVTHHRIHQQFFKVHGFDPSESSHTKWVSMDALQKLTLASAHRKLANQFLG